MKRCKMRDAGYVVRLVRYVTTIRLAQLGAFTVHRRALVAHVNYDE